MNITDQGKPVCFVSKENSIYKTEQGEEYVDLSGGTLVQTLCDLSGFEAKMNNLWYTKSTNQTAPVIEQAKQQIKRLMPSLYQYQYWCASGTDAIEACCKMILSHHFRSKDQKKVPVFITLAGAYHGNGIFSAELNSRPGKRFSSGRYTNLIVPSLEELLEKADQFGSSHAGSKITAAVIEPLGLSTIQFGYDIHMLSQVIAGLHQRGIAVILDEIACGCYRHGYFSITNVLNVHPDFCILSKGLGSGLAPITVAFMKPGPYTDQVTIEGLSISHTYGLTPFAASVLNWVLQQYARCVQQHRFPQLGACLFEFVHQLEKLHVQAELYGLMARIIFPQEEQWIRFQDIMNQHHLLFHITRNYYHDPVVIVAPSYDMDINLLEKYLGILVAELKQHVVV